MVEVYQRAFRAVRPICPLTRRFPSGEGCGAGVASAGMAQREPLTADQRNSFIAALLGWTMDAFDYFLVVLVYADIAKDVRRLADADGVPDHRDAADAPGRRA